ncbi:MAG: alpha/beta fold hydrolase [Anaerolineales bacterium]|nr:alpha/beta fold hydrolase [Anaerolineales bacterium]
MKRWWLVILIILAACQESPPVEIYEVENAALPGDTKPRPTEAAVVDGAAVENTQAERVFENEAVVIAGADGLEIRGTLSYSRGFVNEPGVLLLHMLGSNRTAWDEFVGRLLPAGYTVLAIDMRGHGETGGERAWDLAAEDLQLVWDYFSQRPEVDAERTAVVGGSIGANMALLTAAKLPAIDTAVLLSPGLDYAGVTTAEAVVAYGERPLLIVASEGDTYAADSSRQLADSGAMTTLEIYEGSSHGTAIFAAEPDLTWLILNWLEQHVQ